MHEIEQRQKSELKFFEYSVSMATNNNNGAVYSRFNLTHTAHCPVVSRLYYFHYYTYTLAMHGRKIFANLFPYPKAWMEW